MRERDERGGPSGRLCAGDRRQYRRHHPDTVVLASRNVVSATPIPEIVNLRSFIDMLLQSVIVRHVDKLALVNQEPFQMYTFMV